MWKCSVCEQPIKECECHGPKPDGWRPQGGLAPGEPLPEGHPMEDKVQHKDTPDTFWERMREIHGPDVGPHNIDVERPGPGSE